MLSSLVFTKILLDKGIGLISFLLFFQNKDPWLREIMYIVLPPTYTVPYEFLCHEHFYIGPY